MDPPISLTEWIEAYLYHHRALDHSPKTIRHYQSAFKLFGKYFDAHHLEHDSRVLTSERMQHFATW